MRKDFEALPVDDELELLRNDGDEFAKTRAYLAPLIRGAASRLSDQTLRQPTAIELDQLVPVAARRFLANPRNLEARYRFSTYFTWYISRTIQRAVEGKINPASAPSP
jgi:hypothetical protein